MVKIAFIFICVFLFGCEDKSTHKESIKSAVVVEQNALDALSTTPEKEVKEEPLPEIEFPDNEDAFQEFKEAELSAKAGLLRAQRKTEYLELFKKPREDDPEPKFQLQDKDYGELPKDVSTLPVDRSRILTTDIRINAVLDDDINSQIPGIVMAIVDRPVFSPNQKFILLPLFTKIICEHEGLELQGQTRLPIHCTRAIRPDGVSISLSDAIVADQMGRTGLTGEVDNRTFEIYAGAFIMSGISALAQSGVTPNQPTWRSNSQTALSNNMGQVTAEVIKKNIDLRPVIYIKAGTRLQIRPKVDIVLKEPIPLEKNEEATHEKDHS